MTNERTFGKRNMALLVGLALCIVLFFGAFTGTAGAGEAQTQGDGEGEVMYRESTVSRGDITVGVTETATATLTSHSLSFEIGGEITEFNVKAGQSVKEGDVIAIVSTDDVQEEIDSLQSDYQEALLKLSDAQLSKEKGVIEAQNSYDSTVNKSSTADMTYDMTVEKLEQTVAKAEKEIDEIQTEIRTYTALLRNISTYEQDTDTYTGAQSDYNAAKEWVSDCEKLISEYKKSAGSDFDENDAEYQRLLSNLYSAEEELEYTKLEYEDTAKEYDIKYDTDLTSESDIKAARKDAYDRLEDAEATLKEAEYNLEFQTSEAALTKDQTVTKAETADTTYEMELRSLDNSVASKQLAAQTLQDQIAKQQTYLEKNTIVAPCDGIVSSVNAGAGDEVQAGTAVATISDSANVYVYISVAQDDITGITLDQACTVTMDAFEEVAFSGVVDSITTTPARSASSSASYNVTIQLQGDTAQVYEGMSGSATLITRQAKDVLYVTTRTIYEKDGASYVKVKEADGSISEVPVTTGFSDGRNVEITDGLTEGQTVLIESQVNAQ